MTFTKLFSSITESTIWREDNPTRIVWITMLAMCDKRGRVWASVPGLADRSRVTIAECRLALEKFLGPDPDSRTKDFEGRRIQEIDGGWRVLNYEKHRNIRDEEERKNYKAEWARNYRSKQSSVDLSVDNVDKCRHASTPVDSGRHNADAEADTEKERTKTTPRPASVSLEIPEWVNRESWVGFVEMRKKIRAPLTDRAARGIFKEMDKLRIQGHDPNECLDRAVMNGWRSVYPPKDTTKQGGRNGKQDATDVFRELEADWDRADRERVAQERHDHENSDGPLFQAAGEGDA